MKKEYLILILVVIILVVGFSLFFVVKNKQLTNQIIENTPTSISPTPTPEEISLEILQATDTLQNDFSQSQTSSLSQGATSVNQKEEEEKFYTMDEVVKHNSKESCWTVIRGEVYDLTEWIDNHPGGADKILAICGKDGTQQFVKKHGGKEKPEEILEKFEIGKLETQ